MPRRHGGGPRQGNGECEWRYRCVSHWSKVSDPRNLDASVEEVFQLMLGVNAGATRSRSGKRNEAVTAVVGFGGLLSGACVFRSGGAAAHATLPRT